jgi:hypothetical protein
LRALLKVNVRLLLSLTKSCLSARDQRVHRFDTPRLRFRMARDPPGTIIGECGMVRESLQALGR